MIKTILSGLLISAAAPAFAQAPAPPAAPVAGETIDAGQLALARTTVEAIFPSGSYGRMMREMMGGSLDAAMGGALDMTAADLGVPTDEKGEAPEGTLREKIRQEDPHFEERMRIMSRVMGEEMGRIGATIEPAMREGLTRAVARRFTPAQLAEINAFLATDSGKAFGSQMLMLWVDPEVMTAMMKSMPAMMKEMPAMMKKIEAATAHLPKPKKADKADEQEQDETEEQDPTT